MYALLSELLHDLLCNLPTYYNLSKIDSLSLRLSFNRCSLVIRAGSAAPVSKSGNFKTAQFWNRENEMASGAKMNPSVTSVTQPRLTWLELDMG